MSVNGDYRDGGPAFPVEVDFDTGGGRQTGPSSAMETGLTVRDYFASKAMAAFKVEAWRAYEIADEMLAERAGLGRIKSSNTADRDDEIIEKIDTALQHLAKMGFDVEDPEQVPNLNHCGDAMNALHAGRKLLVKGDTGKSDQLRRVPKRKTIPVEIPVPTVCNVSESYGESSIVEFETSEDSEAFVKAICSAMEGE